MQTFICILRGINVSGHKIIKMAELRISLEKNGFQEVRTYIQSGNIVFKTELNPEQSAEKVKQVILNDFGYEVPTLIRSREEFIRSEQDHPFKSKTEEPKQLHITFLAEAPDPQLVEELGQMKFDDEYLIRDREIFLFCPKGYGKTELHNNFLAGKLKVQATTRNLNTVRKLIALSAD